MSCLVNDTSTTSKRSLWPKKTRDLWVEGAIDSRIQLNHELYDDWASALGANTLGYYRYTHKGFLPAASLPWEAERDLASEFCAAMGTDAVRFFKTGSDAVSCAVRLARAYTSRSDVIVFDKSYHGTGDWFGPALWATGGIPMGPYRHLAMLAYGQEVQDLSLLNVAAIVVEPAPKGITIPPPGWLQHLREVCDANGIILISDEIITGYRHTLRGYMDAAGVCADLLCYGKAMSQGSALSACTGRMDIMSLLASTVHFSGTNSGSPLELAIAQDTLKTYQERDVCAELNEIGHLFRDLLYDAGFITKGLDTRFEIVGTQDAGGYCFDRGILYPGFCSIALTHTTEQMTRLVEVLSQWKQVQH